MTDNNEEIKVEEGKATGKDKLLKTLRIASVALLAVVIILSGTVAGVFFAMRQIGKSSLADRRDDEIYDDYEYDPNLIRLDGETYRYNSELTNFLFLGIDREELGNPDNEYAGGGFSDFILLGVLDEKNSKLTVISIDRNTIVPVQAYDGMGQPLGTSDAQIARCYSYGDGRERSIDLVRDAVSELLYGVPIHAGYAMSLKAVNTVNDMVGGVTLTLDDDMRLGGEEYSAGETVELKENMTIDFLRARSDIGDGSNEQRLSRQKKYMTAFVQQAKKALLGNISLAGDIFSAVNELSCTDIKASEAVYLAEIALKVDIEFRSVAGETVRGDENLDMFYPDTDALYRSVIDVFYVKEG